MDIKQDIKTLFSDVELSEETLTAMNSLLTESVKSKTDPLSEEIVALKVQIAELAEQHKLELTALTEQHKLELEEMETKANEYGAFLQEKADEYGEYIKEQADEYGTFLQNKANDYGKFIAEELSTKIDDYTDYVVEKFVAEHESSLLEQAEYNRMKQLFEDIKVSFEQNHFKLNESQEPQTSDLEMKLSESTKAYTELYNEFVSTKKQLEDAQFAMIFENMTRDLTDTQKERVNNLLKNVSFSSLSEFKRGVELMVEEFSTSTTQTVNELELLDSSQQKKPIDDRMQQYINHL